MALITEKCLENMSYFKDNTSLIAVLLLISVTDVMAGERETTCVRPIMEELIKYGFENVAVTVQNESLFIAYENRLYRDESRAIHKILAICKPYGSYQRYFIIIQNRGMPVIDVVFIKINDKFICLGSHFLSSNAHVWQQISSVKKNNYTWRKLDVVLSPQVTARFGSFNDPVKLNVKIAPTFSTSLWKGMLLSVQWMFNLYSEFSSRADSSHLSLFAVNQTVHFPFSLYASFALGYFTQKRYGFDLRLIKYGNNGLWESGVSLGYTGFASLANNIWYYSSLDQWTGLLFIRYHHPSSDFFVTLSAEKFLFDDKGLRVDFSRLFNEVEIGFFAMKTLTGRNGGFRFSLPIFPAKYYRKGHLQIKPAKYFNWEYRYRGLPEGGVTYDVGANIHDFFTRINPFHLYSQYSSFNGR